MILAEVDVVALMQSAASLATGRAKAMSKAGQSCMGYIKLCVCNENGKCKGAVIFSKLRHYGVNSQC